MKVAVIQLNAGTDKRRNLENAQRMALKATARKAKFILLPEVFNYRGPMVSLKARARVAEAIPGESIRPFQAIAAGRRVYILAGSVYERGADRKIFNTSVLLGPDGKVKAKYRKLKLFRATVGRKKIDENKTFHAGRRPVLTSVGTFKTGLSVCFDVRFPELYRHYAAAGAEILCVPSSFTKVTGEAHWETLIRARAIENLCYVLAPNQTGKDPRGVMTYGHSLIVGPWGEVLARASGSKEEILYAELDKKNLLNRRRHLLGVL